MKKLLLSCIAFAMTIAATAQNGSLKVTEAEPNLAQPISSVRLQEQIYLQTNATWVITPAITTTTRA